MRTMTHCDIRLAVKEFATITALHRLLNLKEVHVELRSGKVIISGLTKGRVSDTELTGALTLHPLTACQMATAILAIANHPENKMRQGVDNSDDLEYASPSSKKKRKSNARKVQPIAATPLRDVSQMGAVPR